MKRNYAKSNDVHYVYDQAKIDAEVKIIIEKKEQQGISLKEVCKFLKRDNREIQRILGRRYKDKHGGILYR